MKNRSFLLLLATFSWFLVVALIRVSILMTHSVLTLTRSVSSCPLLVYCKPSYMPIWFWVDILWAFCQKEQRSWKCNTSLIIEPYTAFVPCTVRCTLGDGRICIGPRMKLWQLHNIDVLFALSAWGFLGGMLPMRYIEWRHFWHVNCKDGEGSRND